MTALQFKWRKQTIGRRRVTEVKGRRDRPVAQNSKAAIAGGNARGALATDVKDVRKVAAQAGSPRKYNSGLQQMVEYAKTLSLFKKR